MTERQKEKMAILNDIWGSLKDKARLKAATIVLHKIDVEKVADYIADYADKNYKSEKKQFVETVYLNLLELVSAINRKRRELNS